ncbi:Toll/interleukin-1 receptor-like protein, partial [Linum grandiflorum]
RQRRPLQVRRPSLLRLPEEESEGIQRCRRGESIDEGIRRAIDNSNFYVVVLTENYASSPWCLDELVMIMDKSRDGVPCILPRVAGRCVRRRLLQAGRRSPEELRSGKSGEMG